MLRVAPLTVALAIILGFIFLINNTNKAGPGVKRRVEYVKVDVNDPTALRQWAEGTCRGWTVQGLASALEIDATMDAIVARLSTNLPSKSRQIVREACELELNRSLTGEKPGTS